jgi:hypothetical protein
VNDILPYNYQNRIKSGEMVKMERIRPLAKEACAKKTGLGFQGKPKSFEVTRMEGDILIVGNNVVQTTIVETDYIVGLTL